jgi:hypothetical protein
MDEFARLAFNFSMKCGFNIESNVTIWPWLFWVFGIKWSYVAAAVGVVVITALVAISVMADMVFVDISAINEATFSALLRQPACSCPDMSIEASFIGEIFVAVFASATVII